MLDIRTETQQLECEIRFADDKYGGDNPLGNACILLYDPTDGLVNFLDDEGSATSMLDVSDYKNFLKALERGFELGWFSDVGDFVSQAIEGL